MSFQIDKAQDVQIKVLPSVIGNNAGYSNIMVSNTISLLAASLAFENYFQLSILKVTLLIIYLYKNTRGLKSEIRMSLKLA